MSWSQTSWRSVAILIAGAATAAQGADYAREIKPLLRERCFACHGALQQKSGLRLDTAGLMLKGGDSGPAIEPGKSGESLLIDALTGANGVAKMPPAGEAVPLTDEQVALLKRWIDAGGTGPADEQPDEDPRQHWAFRAPTRPPLPVLSNGEWARNPIDRFVGAAWERRGLSTGVTADKATLLRRVSIDLTGLPPTRAELHAFLADNSENAYEQVVDRLLASPQYGERWGRHWMDVWRYSDWYGRRNVPDWWNSASQIWRWRDWIVRSLNSDKGYDRMISEMLAADEIAPGDADAGVATGFLVRNWYALNYNLWMRENVEHTAKAFLGLTFNCAHCHDHKYDPISHVDYFRFRAFFEPLELRQDRIRGEPDPGPFQKYEYVKVRKVVRTGLIRVFDERLDAPTVMYAGGDERNRIAGRAPVTPGIPAFLGLPLPEPQTITIPLEVMYPGMQPLQREEELARAAAEIPTAESALKAALEKWNGTQAALEQAVVAARAAYEPARAALNAASYVPGALAPEEIATRTAVVAVQQEEKKLRTALQAAEYACFEVQHPVKLAETQFRSARANLESLHARIAADDVKFAGKQGNLPDLSAAASRLDRAAIHARSELSVAQAEQAVFAARTSPEETRAAEKKLVASRAELAKTQQALEGTNATYTPLGPVYPERSTGRRAALAAWIANRDNPLTARVAVNHIWLRHFGQALVESVYDFGRNGKHPSHPELLDWLAVELMDSGWSQKHLQRLIVTSATYRLASAAPATTPNRAVDPDNRWLWRFPHRRVESEVVRDSLLFTAGKLDLTLGGQELETETAEKSPRRTLYFSIHPEDGGRVPLVESFDPPDPGDCYRRTENVIPQQSLALANSRFARDMSRTVAQALWKEVSLQGGEESSRRSAAIVALFEQVLTRPPNTLEQAECEQFLSRQTELFRTGGALPMPAEGAVAASADPALRAFESLTHAVFNHNEFVTLR